MSLAMVVSTGLHSSFKLLSNEQLQWRHEVVAALVKTTALALCQCINILYIPNINAF